MDMISILTMIGGLMLGIIGYFLKKTMEDLKDVKVLSYQTKSDLDVLRNDHQNKHTNLSEKFDELKLAMQELTKEIKELNKRVK
jgi:peptidoglycan hydrolase CwlO-like protein